MTLHTVHYIAHRDGLVPNIISKMQVQTLCATTHCQPSRPPSPVWTVPLASLHLACSLWMFPTGKARVRAESGERRAEIGERRAENSHLPSKFRRIYLLDLGFKGKKGV